MDVISTDELGGDATLARRVLAVARTIAPIDQLVDVVDGPEPRKDAIAILRGVMADGAARGSRQVSSQRVGPASVSYAGVSSWFTSDDRDALRNLCGITPGASRTPVGRFPLPDRRTNFWPEQYTP